ncbi:MAG: methylenetetrahydrofolate reductase, partial [Alphaproteobacteria bacterium]|nr:methylenetetrahydrofolate reductase [Alphaproteobacteria bacterium]
MDIAEEARLSGGALERLLRAGHFVVTSETTPPLSADPAALLAKVAPLKGVADAVNVTDGAGARSHLSSLATASLMAREGIEPVLQFTLRDRNRLALQNDLLGAAALGIPNVMCLHGDDVAGGDQPEAKMVHDLDSAGLIALACAMRDEGRLPSGREITTPPALLVGAADAPSDPGPDWSPAALDRKIDAGASFFPTQFCVDPAMLRRYMTRL